MLLKNYILITIFVTSMLIFTTIFAFANVIAVVEVSKFFSIKADNFIWILTTIMSTWFIIVSRFEESVKRLIIPFITKVTT